MKSVVTYISLTINSFIWVHIYYTYIFIHALYTKIAYNWIIVVSKKYQEYKFEINIKMIYIYIYVKKLYIYISQLSPDDESIVVKC